MTREEEIRKWIADADHSAPSEIDGCVEPQAPISVSQAEYLIELLDEARKSIEAHAEYLARMTEERNQAVKAKEATELERDEARKERDFFKAAADEASDNAEELMTCCRELEAKVVALEKERDEARDQVELYRGKVDRRDKMLELSKAKVARLEAALRAWEYWYSEESSEFNRETAREMGLKALSGEQGRGGNPTNDGPGVSYTGKTGEGNC